MGSQQPGYEDTEAVERCQVRVEGSLERGFGGEALKGNRALERPCQERVVAKRKRLSETKSSEATCTESIHTELGQGLGWRK